MTNKDYERLGDYITARRIARGMDRSTLASEAGITPRTLGDIEAGKLGGRRDFSQETMEAIGLVLEWKPGSWRRILRGDEPEVTDSANDQDGPDDLQRRVLEMEAKLDKLLLRSEVSGPSPTFAEAAMEADEDAGAPEDDDH